MERVQHGLTTDKGELAGLRAVAALEFCKGALVVLVGFGMFSLSQHGVTLEEIARNLLYTLHLSPERHLCAIFLRIATRLQDTNVLLLAAGGFLYSLMRFVEACGLWLGRVWAQWLALASGALYIPLEIYEVVRKPNAIRFTLLFVNVVIVAYMAWLRWRSHVAAANRNAQSPKVRSIQRESCSAGGTCAGEPDFPLPPRIASRK